MSDASRIPRAIEKFNAYIINTNTYMLTTVAPAPINWTRLGWTAAEMASWTAIVTAWNPLYVKYSDKKGSRTTAIKDQMHLTIKNCVVLDKTNHLLDRIAASPSVSILDMQTFNIKNGVLASSASHTHTALSDVVFSGFSPLGGGDVQIKCRSAHDSKHSSITSGATSVQYTYVIAAAGAAPASADVTGLTKETSTKASFTLHTGSASSGKNLYVFFRWYNAKHPELAGPWSALQTVMIM